jgi:hypothetical protein
MSGGFFHSRSSSSAGVRGDLIERNKVNTFTLEVTMRNARLRLMAGLAGATLCLFAATSYAQTPTTTDAQTPAATTPAPAATDQATPAPTDAATSATVTQSSQTDAVTTTTTRSFPGGTLGILAVAVIVLLLLFGLFRGRDKTVVKETYVTPPVTNRTVTTTTTDDRMNLNSRAASGPGTNPGGPNDPNARS